MAAVGHWQRVFQDAEDARDQKVRASDRAEAVHSSKS